MFWNFTSILILPAAGLRCYFINSFILFILSTRLDEKPENMFYRIKDYIFIGIRNQLMRL